VKKNNNAPVSKFETMFGIDKRALAVFRVLVGMIGIYDMYERWPDIKAHYSDEGLVPRSMVTDNFWNKQWFSIHLISGSVFCIQLIFIVNMIVCFCLMIGYRSRLMMFFNYLFILSIQSRNNIVGHGGDVYMRVICYFTMFLPLGSVFSIDSAFKKPVLRRENKKFSITNFCTFAVILQIIFLYVFSYVHKTGDEWRKDYTASFFALNLDYFRTFLADWILNFPTLLQFMTIAVLYYEGFGFVFLFSPVWTAPIKAFGAIGFTALHIGFAAFMRLGIFSPICATGTLLLYPTWLWDHMFNYVKTRERTDLKLYYSGKHGYRLAALLSTFFLLPEVDVTPIPNSFDQEDIQSNNNNGNGSNGNNGANISDDDGSISMPFSPSINSNWIIVKDHKGIKHTGYKAFITICKASPILFPLAKVLDSRVVSYYGKKTLAICERTICKLNDDIIVAKPAYSSPIALGNHMYHPSGSSSEYSLSDPIPDEASSHYYRRLNRKVRFLKLTKKALFNMIAVVSIVLALSWNCTTVDCGVPIGLPPSLHWTVFLIRVDQMWSMFSPRPPAAHWWYLFEGELDDGTPMELWNNQGLYTWEPNLAPYSREKPDPYPPCIGNHRWFKIYENLNTGQGYELIRLGMGRWVCREFNSRHLGPKRLHKFNIVYRNEKQNLDNTRTIQNDIILWSHICYDKGQSY